MLFTKTTNSLFEPPFGGVRGNVSISAIARWKARGWLPIGDNWCHCQVLRLWALSTELCINGPGWPRQLHHSIDSGADVLGYWRGKEDTGHKLSMCARWILLAPATSMHVFRKSFLRLDELWMTADHSSIQKPLTISCSCTAWQNAANSRVDSNAVLDSRR